MKIFIISLLILAGQLVAAQTETTSTTSTELEEPSSEDNFLLRLEPHWLALRELTIDLQIRVSNNFSIGPVGGYMYEGDGLYYRNKVADRTYYNDKTYRSTYGLRAAYYFSGMNQSSPVVGIFGKQRKSFVKIEPDPWERVSSIFGPTGRNGSAEFYENMYGLTAGYQWVWMDFLNLTVAGGASYFDSPSSIRMEYEDGTSHEYMMNSAQETSYAIDVTIGLKF